MTDEAPEKKSSLINSFSGPPGINFRSEGELKIRAVSQALCKITSFLQNKVHATKLIKYEDWWEHDGLHFKKGDCNIHDLFSLIQTPRALIQGMSGDFNVFTGIAPPDCSWYLRFHVCWNDADEELIGRFDITLSSDHAISFREHVVPKIGCSISEQDAAEYYKSIIL